MPSVVAWASRALAIGNAEQAASWSKSADLLERTGQITPAFLNLFGREWIVNDFATLGQARMPASGAAVSFADKAKWRGAVDRRRTFSGS